MSELFKRHRIVICFCIIQYPTLIIFYSICAISIQNGEFLSPANIGHSQISYGSSSKFGKIASLLGCITENVKSFKNTLRYQVN